MTGCFEKYIILEGQLSERINQYLFELSFSLAVIFNIGRVLSGFGFSGSRVRLLVFTVVQMGALK